MVGGLSKYSGLCILQVIFEAITQLTGAKLGATLKALFEPISSPATGIKFLESEYKKHSDAIAQLEAIEVQVDTVIKTFLLQQMANIIANEAKNTMLLGIPMATVVRDGFQDHSGMVTIVEQAIMEYTNDPERNRRPGTRHPGGPGGKGRGTVASATQALEGKAYQGRAG